MSSSSASICSRLHGIFKNSPANKIPVISSHLGDKISPKSKTKTETKPKSGLKSAKSDLSNGDKQIKTKTQSGSKPGKPVLSDKYQQIKIPVMSSLFKDKISPKITPKSKIKPKHKSGSKQAESDLFNGDKQIKTQPKSGSEPVLSNKDQQIKILVKKFKNSCKSSHYRRSRFHFEEIGKRLSAAGRHSEIEEIVEYQKQFSDITQEKYVVRLISMYGKAGMSDHARKLFDEMPELKCERTVLSFNALLAACVCSKKYDKISGLIAELPDLLKIELDMFSYNIVINAFSSMGDIKSALLVIEEMEKNGIEPDLITYNTLLEGLYKAKMFEEADKVWTVMELKNVSPSVRTYNAKIRGLVSDDQLSQAADLIKEMVKASIKPDVYTYNELIRGSVKADNVFEAKKWYNELANNIIKPANVTFKILLPFALKKLDFKLGFDLCKDAMKHKVTLNVIMVQKIVEGLVKESMIDEAEELVNLGKSYAHYTYKLKMPEAAIVT